MHERKRTTFDIEDMGGGGEVNGWGSDAFS